MEYGKTKVRVRLIVIKNNKILLSCHEEAPKFYYYIGGKLEFRETLAQACVREVREEADAEFSFKKILFIRDFIPKDELEEHSVEFFILGDIDKFDNIHGRNDDLATVKTHLEWVDLGKLKETNVKPSTLTDLILSGYKTNFSEETKYIGEIL